MIKKRILALLLLVLFVAMLPMTMLTPAMTAKAEDEPAPPVMSGNPIIKSIYTADPEGHSWPTDPNTLYIYPSHDPYPYAGCDNMDMYHIFSTKNMVNYVDHGESIRRSDLNDKSWITPSTNAKSFMWAPDAAYKDGYYYFYFPVVRNVGNWGATWETGVVRSIYPDRDFQQIPASDVDSNPGKPWDGYLRDSGSLDGYNSMYDVSVRVYDGEAYMYNGAAQTLWQGKLKDDMVTLESPLELVSTDNQTTANNNGVPEAYRRLANYHEGPSAFRRKGPDGEWIYYLIYPGGAGSYNGLSGDSFYYCMADSPLGPWKDAKIFFNPTGCDTSHGSIFEFKGKWYWVYHTRDLSTIYQQRSVSMEEVIFNADGTIDRFGKTAAGVAQNGPDYVKPAANSTLKVADAVLTGTGTRPTLSEDGTVLSDCGANNTTMTFNNVDGGTGKRATLRFKYSSTAPLAPTSSGPVPKLQLLVNGFNYAGINFPSTGDAAVFTEIEFTAKRLQPGATNTIELRGTNQSRVNLKDIEVVLFEDQEAPGYFDLKVTQAEGGTATAKWLQQPAGADLRVPVESKVTLSYDEGTGEFEGWEVVKPAGLAINGNTFFMPYGDVEIKPIFNTQGNARRPIINTQPKDLTVIQQTDVNLSVEAIVKDAGTLSYQWYRNTTNATTGGTLISGATSATYKVPTANVGVTYYYAIVTNTYPGAVGPVKTATATSLAGMVTVNPPPSTKCDVIDLPAPFAATGTAIKGVVSNQTTSIDLNKVITVSDKANWVLYSNASYTTEANKVITPLLLGDNIRYIRVTAEDKITTKDYVINIVRNPDFIKKFETAPPMDGTLDPAVWGDKLFTLAMGQEGTSTMFNAIDNVAGYGPDVFSADVYSRYDNSNLYLGMVVKDTKWVAARAGTGTLWQGCAFQINVWSGRSGGRSEYGFGLTSTGPTHFQWSTASGGTALATGYNNYSIKRVEGTDTFIYTIAIPLNSFRRNAATTPLAKGDDIWFSLCYNYPSSSNIEAALDMGFHSKNLNDARALVLADSNLLTQTLSGEISNGVVNNVKAVIEDPENTMLFLAAYTERNGKEVLLKTSFFETTKTGMQTIPTNFGFAGATKVKAYLWDKNTMVPLAPLGNIFG